MKTNIQRMLAEAYELEGLLMLADNRGDDTPEYVYAAIGEKIAHLSELAGVQKEVEHGDVDDDAIGVTGYGLSSDSAATASAVAGLDDKADDADELPSLVGTFEEEPAPEEDELAPEEGDEAPDVEAEPLDEETIFEMETEMEPIIPGEEPVEEPVGEPEIEKEELDEVLTDEPLRLDEQLQRKQSKNLKAVISLNDMFRFRRELFANSAADMNDTLNLVEAMSSWDEAEDYFYNDLGWDSESDDVKEFMAIIKNHFL